MLNAAARLAVAVLLTASAPIATAWAQPAVTFDLPPISACGPNNVEGWQFQTTASFTVSALGVYDSSTPDGPFVPGDGLNFSIPVGLYDSGCTLLASATIPAGTDATLIADYRYVGIAPLVLSAGQTYRVAAVMHCDDFTPQFQNPSEFSIDPSLTAVETRRIAFGSSLACPTETSPVISFAPNFLIGPACGNGVVQDTEQCDDGNTMDGDCCSAVCQYEASGSPCEGPTLCTNVGECDGGGACAGTIRNTCRSAGKSIVLVKNPAGDRDKLIWKWLKGAATALAEFGDPNATTKYALCVYAGAVAAPIIEAEVLPSSTFWTPAGTSGLTYRDPMGSSDGVQKLLLKAGAADKAKALFKGKGADLPDPPPGPFMLPVTAQLVNSANGVCFEGKYETADVIRNEPGQFKAKH